MFFSFITIISYPIFPIRCIPLKSISENSRKKSAISETILFSIWISVNFITDKVFTEYIIAPTFALQFKNLELVMVRLASCMMLIAPPLTEVPLIIVTLNIEKTELCMIKQAPPETSE